MNPVLSNGATTSLLAPEISDADARWLLNAIIAHWVGDEYPTDIPAHLVLITRLVISEQDVIKSTMQDNHEKRVAAGKLGGRPKKAEKQCFLEESKKTNAFFGKGQESYLFSEKHKIREDKIRNNSEKEINKEKAPLLTEGSVSESVINLSSNSVSVYFATDPVAYAMKLIKKQDQSNYRSLTKYLNALGIHTFCDVVNEFESELHQGEMKNVRNLAAVLVSKLKKQPTI